MEANRCTGHMRGGDGNKVSFRKSLECQAKCCHFYREKSLKTLMRAFDWREDGLQIEARRPSGRETVATVEAGWRKGINLDSAEWPLFPPKSN